MDSPLSLPRWKFERWFAQMYFGDIGYCVARAPNGQYSISDQPSPGRAWQAPWPP